MSFNKFVDVSPPLQDLTWSKTFPSPLSFILLAEATGELPASPQAFPLLQKPLWEKFSSHAHPQPSMVFLPKEAAPGYNGCVRLAQSKPELPEDSTSMATAWTRDS